jgi:hypothetical protein
MSPHVNAEQVVREFSLAPSDRTGMDGWLGRAELEATLQLEVEDREWFQNACREHHARALDELCAVEGAAR